VGEILAWCSRWTKTAKLSVANVAQRFSAERVWVSKSRREYPKINALSEEVLSI
jgi:hypothetical protein